MINSLNSNGNLNRDTGGVQPHSVGEAYPIVVVGYGNGTFRAEYAGVRSRPFAKSSLAYSVALEARKRLDKGRQSAISYLGTA